MYTFVTLKIYFFVIWNHTFVLWKGTFVFWKCTFVLGKFFFCTLRVTFYSESVLVYFESITFVLESIFLQLWKYTYCMKYFCTLPQCLLQVALIINTITSKEKVVIISTSNMLFCCWGYHLRLFWFILFQGYVFYFKLCWDSIKSETVRNWRGWLTIT